MKVDKVLKKEAKSFSYEIEYNFHINEPLTILLLSTESNFLHWCLFNPFLQLFDNSRCKSKFGSFFLDILTFFSQNFSKHNKSFISFLLVGKKGLKMSPNEWLMKVVKVFCVCTACLMHFFFIKILNRCSIKGTNEIAPGLCNKQKKVFNYFPFKL